MQVEANTHFENQHSWNREMHQRPIAFAVACCRLATLVMYLRELVRGKALVSEDKRLANDLVHIENKKYLIRVVAHTTGLSSHSFHEQLSIIHF